MSSTVPTLHISETNRNISGRTREDSNETDDEMTGQQNSKWRRIESPSGPLTSTLTTERKQSGSDAGSDDAPKQQNKSKSPLFSYPMLRFTEQTDRATGRKPRIHPKEAGHRIDDLPSLPQAETEVGKMTVAELVKSLGLQVAGDGRNVELWYVGSDEQEDGADSALGVKESPHGEQQESEKPE